MADRLTLGRMQNPVRGFLHGSAAVASAVGTLVLAFRVPHWPARISVLVFGLGLIGLYSTSSLYHSVPWRTLWKLRMQKVDHSMIFVLIAATYTPIAWIALDDPIRLITLAVVWSIAFTGIVQKAVSRRRRSSVSIAIMVTMGWISIPLMYPIAQEAGWSPVALLAIGGVLYTVGMVCLVTNRPRLWPRVFSYHEVFHIFVVAASLFHFAVAYFYIAPLA